MLMEVMLCLCAEFSTPALYLPNLKECTERHVTAMRFHQNIKTYADECRKAYDIAGSYATRLRVMEAEVWEKHTEAVAEAWMQSTWVQWRHVQREERLRRTPGILPIWRRP